MKTSKKVLIVTLPILIVAITIMAVTQASKIKLFIIEKVFGISLPNTAEIVKFDVGLNHYSAAHIVLPEAIADDFEKAVNNTGYYKEDINSTIIEDNFISWWDLDKSKVTACYEQMTGKLLSPHSTLTMDIYIVKSNNGNVSIYLCKF